jgi:hypothetical protein
MSCGKQLGTQVGTAKSKTATRAFIKAFKLAQSKGQSACVGKCPSGQNCTYLVSDMQAEINQTTTEAGYIAFEAVVKTEGGCACVDWA